MKIPGDSHQKSCTKTVSYIRILIKYQIISKENVIYYKTYYYFLLKFGYICCRSPCGNVDWNNGTIYFWHWYVVVPLVGTWIEIVPLRKRLRGQEVSFPLWERGLKCPYLNAFMFPGCRSPCGNVDWNNPKADWLGVQQTVVPLVGTWIEIVCMIDQHLQVDVVPLVGTWIEIPPLSFYIV